MFGIIDDLAEMPDDPVQVCGIMSRFLDSWNGVPTGAVLEVAEREVMEAEQRLGVVLPVALRWLLTHVGYGNSVVGHQDPLISPRLMHADDHGVISYRKENQNCARWGVRVADFEKSDPPVVWMEPGENVGWSPYHDRLSVDLLEFVLNEVMLLPGANVLQAELLAGVPSELRKLPHLDIPRHIFWPMPEGSRVEWYRFQNCMIRNDGDSWLWAFAPTSTDVRQVSKMIPVKWSGLSF